MRRPSGERYLLVGDAAGLAQDFSGEGIGPAVRSACMASDIALDWRAGHEPLVAGLDFGAGPALSAEAWVDARTSRREGLQALVSCLDAQGGATWNSVGDPADCTIAAALAPWHPGVWDREPAPPGRELITSGRKCLGELWVSDS